MADFKVKFAGAQEPNFKAEMGEVHTVSVGAPPYDGPYTITPKNEAQKLNTKDMRMVEDVVIEPIPQEYGLVTYDNRKIIKIT